MVNKFSPKIGNGVLMDKDFEKPQAFHKEPAARSGGLASIISLTIFFILYYFLFQQTLTEYLVLSIALFFLGLIVWIIWIHLLYIAFTLNYGPKS